MAIVVLLVCHCFRLLFLSRVHRMMASSRDMATDIARFIGGDSSTVHYYVRVIRDPHGLVLPWPSTAPLCVALSVPTGATSHLSAAGASEAGQAGSFGSFCSRAPWRGPAVRPHAPRERLRLHWAQCRAAPAGCRLEQVGKV